MDPGGSKNLMRFLGIDYGEKRIGIAISDEEGKFAFPLAVLENDLSRTFRRKIQVGRNKFLSTKKNDRKVRDKKILAEIKKICEKEKARKIVLGLPLDLKNQPTHSTRQVENFKIKLEKITGLPVSFEKEFFTTKEAERIQGKHKKIDASAAALILKHYLSTMNYKKK